MPHVYFLDDAAGFAQGNSRGLVAHVVGGYLELAVNLMKEIVAQYLTHLHTAYYKQFEEVALSRNAEKAKLKLDQKHLDSSRMGM